MDKYIISVSGEFEPIIFQVANLEDLILFLDDYEIEHDDIYLFEGTNSLPLKLFTEINNN